MALTPDTDQFSQFLRYAFLRSPNFATGVSGWTINQDGSAEFNNITIRNGQIISGTFLLYSATPPAKGNLVLAFAPITGGTDSVGNVYPQGFNFGVWDATGALKQHFGINASGDTFLANSSGLIVVHERSSDGSEFFYNTSGEGLGNLRTSITPAAGTDSPGNTTVAGIGSYGPGGLVGQLLNANLNIFATSDNTPGGLSGGGGGLLISSGKVLLAQTISVLQLLSSGSPTGVAQAVFVAGGTPTPHTTALVEIQGSAAANSLTAIVSNALETWHNATLNAANFTNAGFGAATSFQLEPINGGRVRLRGSVNLASNQAAGTTVFTLPAGYVPVANQFFTTVNSLSGFSASTGSIKVTSAGAVTINCAGVTGNFVMFDGIVIELD